MSMSESPAAQDMSLRNITMVVYGLQAAAFLVGITFIAAVIVNYIKRPDVAGTIYESHFTWQIRTFWWSLLWGFLTLLTIWIGVGFLIGMAAAIWLVYRIVKGWLNLNEGKPVP
jgi:uncharacterized membrane protein